MVSKHTPVREWAQFRSSNSRPRGCRVSYGEPIALRGQLELEQVAVATPLEARPATAEALFIERLRSGEIYGLLYRLTESREEARDLTQETFLRAFQNISSFRGESDLRTWIYRI